MTTIALLSSSPSPSLFWTAFGACVGGVFVFSGLLIEKAAEKGWFGFATDLHRKNRTTEIGWSVLMIGIAIEIVTAGQLAIKEERELKQIKAAAAENDPLNQPIFNLSVQLHIKLNMRGSAFVERRGPGTLSNNVAMMFLCDEKSTLNGSHFNLLVADHVLFDSTNRNSGAYSMQFHDSDISTAVYALVGNGMRFHQVRELQDIKFLRIDAWFLPENAEVEGGHAILLAGTKRKAFQIPPQSNFKNAGLMPLGGTGFVFIATNSQPGKLE
jgi:hypothetical protein